VEDGRSLFGLIAAKQEIEELIRRKVDIVTEDSLRGPRRESILRDTTAL
jgi:predicted nucleotidyltransferase